MDTATPVPIPHDVALGLPATPFNLELLVVFSFLLHILFINLTVGASVLTLFYEIVGLFKKEYDALAREVGITITVNKSLAVVLGVGPLLILNVYYTVYFYSANALTGTAWLMVVPLVTTAFLLSYLHKYTWDKLAEQKGLHIAIVAASTGLFLTIPLIFLSNINLMLFPERWVDVQGWLSTLLLPNVIPRYLHFFFASLAFTGLFLAVYFGRSKFAIEDKLPNFSRPFITRHFYGLAFSTTLIQFFVGPLLFFTLPSKGISWELVYAITIGFTLAIFALFVLWNEITKSGEQIGAKFWIIILLLTGTVIFMAYGRHLYREGAVGAHKKLVAEKTQTLVTLSQVARWRESQGLGGLSGEQAGSLGEKVFKGACASCHEMNSRLVGPPLTEIYDLYKEDIEGMIAWIKDPGRKRPNYQPMPAIMLTEEQYQAVAEYVIEKVEEAQQPAQEEPATQEAAGEVQSATGSEQ